MEGSTLDGGREGENIHEEMEKIQKCQHTM